MTIGVDGRGENGFFAPGNKHGRGNPHATHSAMLKRAFKACATEDDVKQYYAKLKDLALAGDVTALKLALEHTIGRPTQSVEITGADGDSMQVQTADLTGVILGALAEFPEAKLVVAARLRGLNRATPPALEATTEGAGDGSTD